jgi:5-methylcytosine-specific restriction endonuclease McrA
MEALLLRSVLVLDAGYQAVNVVPVRRALALLATGRAVPVQEEEDTLLHSERSVIRCPVIIRLFISVAHRVYRSFQVKFNKRNVMARDAYECQYCGRREIPLTIDHIVPRSRRTPEHPEGRQTDWQNCVTACLECNMQKGSRTPEEAGMRLRSKPAPPRWMLPALHRKSLRAHQSWSSFLAAAQPQRSVTA